MVGRQTFGPFVDPPHVGQVQHSYLAVDFANRLQMRLNPKPGKEVMQGFVGENYRGC